MEGAVLQQFGEQVMKLEHAILALIICLVSIPAVMAANSIDKILQVTSCSISGTGTCYGSGGNLSDNNIATKGMDISKSATGTITILNDTNITSTTVIKDVEVYFYHGAASGITGNWTITFKSAGGSTYCTTSRLHTSTAEWFGWNLTACIPDNASIKDLTIAMASGDGGSATLAYVYEVQVNVSYNNQLTVNSNIADSPDPIAVNNNITYTATGTDPEGEQYRLTVCNATGITKGYPGTCTVAGNTLCTSAATNSGTQAACQYNATTDQTLTAYGYLCDAGSLTCKAASSTTTTVNPIYGVLNVTITSPVNNLNITQNSTFTLNATIICTGPTGAKCGDVYAYARYNDSSAVPDMMVNLSGSIPLSTIKSSSIGDIFCENILSNDDTFVYKGSPNNNFNGSSLIIESNWSGGASEVRRIVIKFPTNLTYPLSSLINATLYLNKTYTTGTFPRNYEICNTSANWQDNVVTWNTQPACNLFMSNATIQSTLGYYLWNITLGFATTNANFSMVIKDTAELGGIRAESDFSTRNDFSAPIMTVCYYPIIQTEQPNPLSQSSLLSGQTFNVSWTVNATGTNNTQYYVDVFANSSYGTANVPSNDSADRKVCIGICPTEGPADTTFPAVNINMSLEGKTFTTSTPKIDFNYTDNAATASCNLYFNTTLKGSNAAVSNNTQTSITASSTANGAYRANVTCSDGTNTNVSIGVNITIATADTCTYPGSGDWDINCADGCLLSTNTDLLQNNINIYGTGTTTIAAVINNWKKVTWYNSCRLNFKTGGRLG